MVVSPAPLVTDLPPATDLTLLDGLRVGGLRIGGTDVPGKETAHVAVVGQVIVRTKGLGRKLAPWRDNVHAIWHKFLNPDTRSEYKQRLNYRATFGRSGSLASTTS